jgi:hypothetical protein
LQTKPAPDLFAPSRGGTRRPEETLNYWDAVLKRSWDGGGNVLKPYLKPLTTFPEQDGAVYPTCDTMHAQYSYEPSGHDIGAHMKDKANDPSQVDGIADSAANKDTAESGQTSKEYGDHYILFSREDQRVYWIDPRTGTVINSWDASSAFEPGVNENGEPRESLPVGTYEATAEITDGKYGPAYGTFYITTGDPRGRDFHGGGSGLEAPYAPYQKLKPTFGCLRGHNADGEELCRLMFGQGGRARLIVINGPARLSDNDLR